MSDCEAMVQITLRCAQLGWNPPSSNKLGKSSCRYGLTWTPVEERNARNMFEAGHNVKDIAIVHGRDEGGIRSKLRSRGWLDDFQDGNTKHGTFLDQQYEYTFLNFQPITQNEEPTMNNTDNTEEINLNTNKPIVEQVTMVRGQDVRKLKPQHLISIIREIEAEINDLSSFTVQSKYIAARLTQLRDDLTKVVEVLDTM